MACSTVASKPPDMSKCSKKERCCGGAATHGQIYDPADPCEDGFTYIGNCLCQQCTGEQPTGWVFVQWAAKGSCYQATYNVPPECCGQGTPVNGYGYFTTYEAGDSGQYDWSVNTAGWDGPSSQSPGTWTIGSTIEVFLKEGVTWTSDNTPFESPYPARAAACSGDSTGCNEGWWGSCGATFCGSKAKFTSFVFNYADSGCDCSAQGINISTAAGKKACYEFCNGGPPSDFSYA